jgi:hypothetical protein
MPGCCFHIRNEKADDPAGFGCSGSSAFSKGRENLKICGPLNMMFLA